jgi:MYXO-CTERM domain-containing protein
VKLAGSATHPSNLPLTYLWSQVAGPEVTLVDGGTATPSFKAPDTNEPITITLALRAHDGALLSAASRVDIVVEPAKAGDDSAGCACRTTPSSRPATGALALVGIAALFARRSRRR